MKLDKDTVEIVSIWANKIPVNEFSEDDQGHIKIVDYTQVLGIDWACNLGWGRYELEFTEDGKKILAYSEFMDSNDDKKLLKALLDKVVEKAIIVD